MVDSTKTAIRIIEYAKIQGMSQKYICEQLGLARSYILDAKNGKAKITPDRLEKIAAILHTTPAYLMDKTDDPALPETKKEPTVYGELSDKKKAFLDWAMSADESTIDLLLGIAERIKEQKK